MFEELNKKALAARMSSSALPEFRSKSQALLFSLMYYRCDHIGPDGQLIRAKDLYKFILEEIPSLKETDILITPKSMVEETKEIVDHIFNKTDKGLERFKKEVFGNLIQCAPFSFKDFVEVRNRILEAEKVKDVRYRGCCDPGVPEDKCEPDCDPGMPEDKCEPEPENVCQGHPCDTQEREEINEVPQDEQPEHIREEETEESSDSGSDV